MAATHPTDGDSSRTYEQVEAELLQRWPETRLEPSLDRIAALCDLLGSPQQASPVLHITGTNGKTSTARMCDDLVRGLGLRTGRFTSPHVERMTERICIDGQPLEPRHFADLYAEVLPYVETVDRSGPVAMSFFEIITGMAFAAFADAPVDAMVLEVGMGGTWDATNVADGSVGLVLPIAVDHARYLGSTPAEIAQEKAGIIKPGAFAVLAQQSLDVAEVLLRRAAEVEAVVVREGPEFGVTSREPAVGGQLLTLRGITGEYPEVFLPLYGAHQAHNAACALAGVEAFGGGGEPMEIDAVRAAFAAVTSPARLELVRRSPSVVLDAAHNPQGAEAIAAAVTEAFSFAPLIGVLSVMADKDVEGLLAAFEPAMAAVVCTQNSSPRSMPAEQLAAAAAEVFGADRVEVAPRLDDAIDAACRLAESADNGAVFGRGGVLVTGSVVTAGEARSLLARR
jgi:dihydrofolate synthase/folylpolyglutamate synthase